MNIFILTFHKYDKAFASDLYLIYNRSPAARVCKSDTDRLLMLYLVLTECALIVSGTLTLRLYGLYSVIEGLQLQRNLTFSYANMVVVTLIWLAVFNLICLRLLPIDSGLVQTFKFSCT